MDHQALAIVLGWSDLFPTTHRGHPHLWELGIPPPPPRNAAYMSFYSHDPLFLPKGSQQPGVHLPRSFICLAHSLPLESRFQVGQSPLGTYRLGGKTQHTSVSSGALPPSAIAFH